MLINSLSLKNFKCFEELNVDFRPITLLTGANSSGKSSLINAILAMMQTEQFPFYLSPNGKYVNMGSFEEIVHSRKTDREIEINLVPSRKSILTPASFFESQWITNEHNGQIIPKKITLDFEGDQLIYERWRINIEKIGFGYKMTIDGIAHDTRFERAIINPLDRITLMKEKMYYNKPNKLYFEHFFKKNEEIFDLFEDQNFIIKYPLLRLYPEKNFNYIGSFRLPPERTYYQKSKAQSRINTDGSGCIDQIIEWKNNNDDKINYLIKILQEMKLLEDILPGALVGGRFELNVKSNSRSEWASLTDVGFGISQFLPIIVADLQLSDNSCLAVSQPEIHLHPKVQASFGNYLANQVNSTKKQYIIETHSEYLLNRIRLLLVTGELKPEQVRVLYFENDGIKSTVHDIEFATDGQVKGAPQGFFDTYGIDVMNIAMEAAND